ncbi:hypothetical protein EDB80DRAFT_818396 [Ilyonectria destructans]|nr:hypothetical protein EDB80DRAFT_818396 [Ilyonectria destructans]
MKLAVFLVGAFAMVVAAGKCSCPRYKDCPQIYVECCRRRDRTTKTNCRYWVEQVQPGPWAVEEHTVEAVRRLGATMAGRQKGVVYYRSKAQCEAMAEEIGCDHHHSGTSEGERRRVRTAWAESQGHGHRHRRHRGGGPHGAAVRTGGFCAVDGPGRAAGGRGGLSDSLIGPDPCRNLISGFPRQRDLPFFLRPHRRPCDHDPGPRDQQGPGPCAAATDSRLRQQPSSSCIKDGL